MAKNVIYIFGAAGSGTSTLGKELSEQLGYKWMDTDDYFWEPTNPPFTTQRERSERVRLMREDIERYENVVISGCVGNWGNALCPFFTLAVRVVIDSELRLARLKKREQERFGERIAPGGDMYEHHLEFIEWASKYDTAGVEIRSKAKHDEWQNQLLCPIIVVDSVEDVGKNCELIKRAIL